MNQMVFSYLTPPTEAEEKGGVRGPMARCRCVIGPAPPFPLMVLPGLHHNGCPGGRDVPLGKTSTLAMRSDSVCLTGGEKWSQTNGLHFQPAETGGGVGGVAWWLMAVLRLKLVRMFKI